MSRINKEKAKNILSNVPEEKTFWTNDGRILRNLQDLSNALSNISEEAFKYHVSEDKNDFNKWINDVIEDEKLARDISKTKKKDIITKKINKRIEQLTKLLNKQ